VISGGRLGRLARQLALGVVLVLAACTPREPELTVFAAASLRDACVELGQQFEARGGERVYFHFAGSTLLARQILTAPAADVFLSADERQVDRIEAAGLALPGTRRSLCSNRLVVIVAADSLFGPASAEDLAGVERLSLADPRLAPAGRYARTWLEERGVWDQLADRVLLALDVRAALAAVEAGAAQAGVCYATDAALSGSVRVAFTVPPEQASDISYAACALEDSAGGARFVEFLASPEALAVFEQYGFTSLAGAIR